MASPTNPTLARALQQLVAQQPHFGPCVAPGPDSLRVSLRELCEPTFVLQVIHRGQQTFSLENPRHAAQLWFYSLCNSVVGPAMNLMVEHSVYPSLELGELFSQDGQGYWLGYQPSSLVDGPLEAGEELGAAMAQVIAALSEATGMKQAPLWAVLSDAVIQSGVAAGNDAFEPEHALEVIATVREGIQKATSRSLPPAQIDGLSVDGEIMSVEQAEYLLAHRASCCMIYSSPQAQLCTSCPKREKQERIQGQIQAVLF